MRGHIGYKIPRQPTPTIRLSFATFDALTFEAATAESRLSFLGFDALTYAAATAEAYLSFLGFDALTYEPPATAAYVSHLGFDAITYSKTAPDAPTDVFGTGTDGSVVLTWRAAGAWGQAATNHTVQYKVSTDTEWTTVATNSALTTFTVTGLTLSTLYTFRVSATNSIGTGPYSLLADASPMASVASFSASMYLLTDWDWDTFGGDTVLGVANSSFPALAEQAAGHTSAYFDFWPADYAAGETYFQFVTGINDGAGVNRQTTCASTTYQETGANEASCEYSYQFQRRQPGATEGLQGEWTNVYTDPVTSNFGNEGTLPRPRYPQELAITRGYTTTLYYAAGVKYDHRCIVTRKSDGAKYVTYTCTVLTSSSIN